MVGDVTVDSVEEYSLACKLVLSTGDVNLWRAVADMQEARIWRVPDIALFNWADLALSWNVKTLRIGVKEEG